MRSTETSHNRGPGEACAYCRAHKRRCEKSNSRACVKCERSGRVCSLARSTMMIATNAKRKIGEIENMSDSEYVQANRATSSITVSHSANDVVNDGNADQLQHKPSESSKLLPQNQQPALSGSCGLCQVDRQSSRNKVDNFMIQCDIDNCIKSYHLSCIWFSKDPRHRVLICAGNSKSAGFVCPDCLDSAAQTTIRSEIDRLKQRASSENDATPGSAIQVKSSGRESEIQQDLRQEVKIVDLAQVKEISFEPTRKEKFQGYHTEEVDGLVRNLRQSILNYDTEMREAIDHFGNGNDAWMKAPLAAWRTVDSSENIISGQSWYHIEGTAKKQSMSHSPITAALRSMLYIPPDEPLDIDHSLLNLTFSQVHTGFLGWFVFDVLNNEVDFYQLPNMKAMRAMVAGVSDFGEARWPGNGRNVLREVHLRTWYKEQFQDEMLLDLGQLGSRMKAYLEPLTKKFDKICTCAYPRRDIIRYTLKLWSYLQSLGGNLELIHPAIGNPFDRQFHDAYDEEGVQQNPDQHSKKKILWILSRGLHCTVSGPDGPFTFTIKAHVVVR